eukprot:TRINITY_DN18154_c0_g1_i1.p1 TRINITY_DN18154_c0_g1~~TRINITY_DN18154_c0_g1_i1.p1  ORF type:complete len:1392 (+),score=317.99 TRINITY_DN18154_c0_g1_i1:94-4269(+)
MPARPRAAAAASADQVWAMQKRAGEPAAAKIATVFSMDELPVPLHAHAELVGGAVDLSMVEPIEMPGGADGTAVMPLGEDEREGFKVQLTRQERRQDQLLVQLRTSKATAKEAKTRLLAECARLQDQLHQADVRYGQLLGSYRDVHAAHKTLSQRYASVTGLSRQNSVVSAMRAGSRSFLQPDLLESRRRTRPSIVEQPPSPFGALPSTDAPPPAPYRSAGSFANSHRDAPHPAVPAGALEFDSEGKDDANDASGSPTASRADDERPSPSKQQRQVSKMLEKLRCSNMSQERQIESQARTIEQLRQQLTDAQEGRGARGKRRRAGMGDGGSASHITIASSFTATPTFHTMPSGIPDASGSLAGAAMPVPASPLMPERSGAETAPGTPGVAAPGERFLARYQWLFALQAAEAAAMRDEDLRSEFTQQEQVAVAERASATQQLRAAAATLATRSAEVEALTTELQQRAVQIATLEKMQKEVGSRKSSKPERSDSVAGVRKVQRKSLSRAAASAREKVSRQQPTPMGTLGSCVSSSKSPSPTGSPLFAVKKAPSVSFKLPASRAALLAVAALPASKAPDDECSEPLTIARVLSSETLPESEGGVPRRSNSITGGLSSTPSFKFMSSRSGLTLGDVARRGSVGETEASSVEDTGSPAAPPSRLGSMRLTDANRRESFQVKLRHQRAIDTKNREIEALQDQVFMLKAAMAAEQEQSGPAAGGKSALAAAALQDEFAARLAEVQQQCNAHIQRMERDADVQLSYCTQLEGRVLALQERYEGGEGDEASSDDGVGAYRTQPTEGRAELAAKLRRVGAQLDVAQERGNRLAGLLRESDAENQRLRAEARLNAPIPVQSGMLTHLFPAFTHDVAVDRIIADVTSTAQRVGELERAVAHEAAERTALEAERGRMKEELREANAARRDADEMAAQAERIPLLTARVEALEEELAERNAAFEAQLAAGAFQRSPRRSVVYKDTGTGSEPVSPVGGPESAGFPRSSGVLGDALHVSALPPPPRYATPSPPSSPTKVRPLYEAEDRSPAHSPYARVYQPGPSSPPPYSLRQAVSSQQHVVQPGAPSEDAREVVQTEREMRGTMHRLMLEDAADQGFLEGVSAQMKAEQLTLTTAPAARRRSPTPTGRLKHRLPGRTPTPTPLPHTPQAHTAPIPPPQGGFVEGRYAGGPSVDGPVPIPTDATPAADTSPEYDPEAHVRRWMQRDEEARLNAPSPEEPPRQPAHAPPPPPDGDSRDVPTTPAPVPTTGDGPASTPPPEPCSPCERAPTPQALMRRNLEARVAMTMGAAASAASEPNVSIVVYPQVARSPSPPGAKTRDAGVQINFDGPSLASVLRLHYDPPDAPAACFSTRPREPRRPHGHGGRRRPGTPGQQRRQDAKAANASRK